MKTTRRQALQFGLSGAAAFGLTAIKPGLAIGRMPSSAAPDRKMLVIFGRGANDALNSIIPHGDPGYALSRNRPGIGDIAFRRAGTGGPRNSIVIPGAGSFAEAHPAMGDLINGAPWANGHLALLHRVGNPWGKRSHFTEMQVIESADAPQATGRPRRDGWVNRLGNVIYSTSAMQSVSLSSRVQTSSSPTRPRARRASTRTSSASTGRTSSPSTTTARTTTSSSWTQQAPTPSTSRRPTPSRHKSGVDSARRQTLLMALMRIASCGKPGVASSTRKAALADSRTASTTRRASRRTTPSAKPLDCPQTSRRDNTRSCSAWRKRRSC